MDVNAPRARSSRMARTVVLAAVIVLATVAVAVSIHPSIGQKTPAFAPSAVVVSGAVLVIVPAVTGRQRIIISGPTDRYPCAVWQRRRQTRRQQRDECNGGRKQEDFPGKIPNRGVHIPMHRDPEGRRVHESARSPCLSFTPSNPRPRIGLCAPPCTFDKSPAAHCSYSTEFTR
jgi:hypothetical protein